MNSHQGASRSARSRARQHNPCHAIRPCMHVRVSCVMCELWCVMWLTLTSYHLVFHISGLEDNEVVGIKRYKQTKTKLKWYTQNKQIRYLWDRLYILIGTRRQWSCSSKKIQTKPRYKLNYTKMIHTKWRQKLGRTDRDILQTTTGPRLKLPHR